MSRRGLLVAALVQEGLRLRLRVQKRLGTRVQEGLGCRLRDQEDSFMKSVGSFVMHRRSQTAVS